MAKVKDLPAVPADPVRPPPASIAGEEPLEIVTRDGVSLEARIVVPPGARRVVVIAHPHPLYGGTMHNAVVLALARVVGARGGAVVRFNFRGVGESGGTYDAGRAEVLDVVAALDAGQRALPGAPVTAVGYSFGSWVTLRAATGDGEAERVMLIAPAARLFDFASPTTPRFSGPTAIALGDRDAFCDVDEARPIAAHLHASLRVFEGADHFFLNGRRALAEAIAPFVLGDVDAL